jgi:hypothetical protein
MPATSAKLYARGPLALLELLLAAWATSTTLALRQRLADRRRPGGRWWPPPPPGARARGFAALADAPAPDQDGRGGRPHRPRPPTEALVRVDAVRPSGYAGATRPGRKG